MPESIQKMANEYAEAVHTAEAAGVAAEQEAQLTIPVAVLVRDLAAALGLPDTRLLRESQLVGVRPDFQVLVGGRESGWVELKRPGRTVDGDAWTGREKTQWAELSKLDALIVCNGRVAQLYRLGEAEGEPATLPYEPEVEWDPAGLIAVLRRFVEMRPKTVTRVSDLAHRLAPLAGMLRQRLAAGMPEDGPPLPVLARAKTVWANNVHEGVDDDAFCNDLAQVIAYGLAIAGLQGDGSAPADSDEEGDVVTLRDAQNRLRVSAPVLAAALGPVLGVPGLTDVFAAELAAIERLVTVLDLASIARSHDWRGEPWLWFYEDFLATYDPQARKQAGVYYTPTAVVQCQVRLVDHVLRERFGRRYGLGNEDVVVLDPACGSGTYPLAVIDQAAVNVAPRGPAGPRQAARTLADRLIAFELLPGPYAVASLRIGRRLTELAGSTTPIRANVYLTDTLDSPDLQPPNADLFGDAAQLAAERIRARDVKRDRRVMVVLGNPPYKRVRRDDAGGWVVHGPRQPKSLIDEVVDRAIALGVRFSATRSTYNLYVYFWRWALWKAFEAHGEGPAVVSFITASSWLSGPGFVGLREAARHHGDEIWVIDLGGDNKGAQPEENIFAIETPVAIVTIIRDGASTANLAEVRYRKLTGTAGDKIRDLATVNAPDGADDAAWSTVPSSAPGDALVPVTGDLAWQEHPALSDLLPWQQPGVIVGRTWPVAAQPDALKARWRMFVGTGAETRAAHYVTAKTGRNIGTVVNGMPTLASLPGSAPTPPVRRYGWRSFDRQWILDDPRLMTLDRPSLWRTENPQQLFFTSMMTNALGTGPALTVSAHVPDFHYFANRGGKDVMPLWRDAEAQKPNLAPGITDALAATRVDHVPGTTVSPQDVYAYIYALLSTPGYQERFSVELATAGPRVPLTGDPTLFDEAVELGRQLIWLHTYAERQQDPAAGRGRYLPDVAGLGWRSAVTRPPVTLATDVRYDAETETLHVGDGNITGVSPQVWEYSVSGLQVVRKWLGYRTVVPSGRAAHSTSPLDAVRPSGWPDAWNDELLDLLRLLTLTLALHPRQDDLLDRVLQGPLIDAATLGVLAPQDALRHPPTDTPNGEQATLPGT